MADFAYRSPRWHVDVEPSRLPLGKPQRLIFLPIDRSSNAASQRRLSVAIFERIYQQTQSRDISLIVHSIPAKFSPHDEPLDEVFPQELFDKQRPGLLYVPGKTALTKLRHKDEIYRVCSHFHFTPRAHEISGEMLATAILASGLLER